MASTKRIRVWLDWVRSAPALLKVRADAVYIGLKRIRSLRRGQNSGDVILKLVDDPEAASYKARWTVAPEWEPESWVEIPVPHTWPATLIKGLKPGVTYLFQACALINYGYTDWSDSVTYLCT